jgi:hypothetical protein
MRKFSPDQLALAILLGAIIMALTLYRMFNVF